jgi:hypothetical protein
MQNTADKTIKELARECKTVERRNPGVHPSQPQNLLQSVFKEVLKHDLKKVYQALTMEEAELAFEMFKEKWGKKHPIIIRSWENNWLELTAYFKYPYEIRKSS